MGKRGSRTWHRNEHSWRQWLNCWVSPCSAAHAQPAAPEPAGSPTLLTEESSSQSSSRQQQHQQFFSVVMFATTIGISATVEKCPLAQAVLRKERSCCPCCMHTCLLWCRQHLWLYQGFIRLVCCWVWISSSLLGASVRGLVLKWFLFLGWQVKKETLSHHEPSVHEGGTASAVTPFSKADSTDFKPKKK